MLAASWSLCRNLRMIIAVSFSARRPPAGAVWCLDDVLRSYRKDMDEPKNSGRRVAVALEVEVA